MTINLAYGKRTGVTTFKGLALELCETLRKFEPLIRAWISVSGISPTDAALIVSLINACDAACAAVKGMPDD